MERAGLSCAARGSAADRVAGREPAGEPLRQLPGAERTVSEPAEVVLVVEITSPDNAMIDRAVKPQLYTQAGIPHHLLIELGVAPPTAVVFELRRGRYVPVRRVDSGARLRLDEPSTSMSTSRHWPPPPAHRT
ncbi:MAG: Uma2 family endonuclease [Pseudonocardiaceae bacterium]